MYDETAGQRGASTLKRNVELVSPPAEESCGCRVRIISTMCGPPRHVPPLFRMRDGWPSVASTFTKQNPVQASLLRTPGFNENKLTHASSAISRISWPDVFPVQSKLNVTTAVVRRVQGILTSAKPEDWISWPNVSPVQGRLNVTTAVARRVQGILTSAKPTVTVTMRF